MVLERIWAMPDKYTYKIKPIRNILSRYINDKSKWADPFANNSNIVEWTNDIDTGTNAKYHFDAHDFLQQLDSNSLDGVLLDPPYSFHQATKTYNNKRFILVTLLYKEINRILKQYGTVIHFGWNSNGIGEKHGFKKLEVLIVPHGGHHNDTIVTVETKIRSQQNRLDL